MKKRAEKTNTERNPPSLPRRKRSTVSDRTEHTANQSAQSSFQDATWRTAELTPFSHDPITPANSRHRESSNSSCDSGRLLHLPLNEKQLSSQLNFISLEAARGSLLSDAKVRAFFNDWFEDYGTMCGKSVDAWSLFFEHYYSPEYKFVRPSGNPIDRSGFAKLVSIDAVVTSVKLVSIDSIFILKNQLSAVVTYTTDQMFIYKGTTNADRAIISCVLESIEGEIKVIHEHRTSGRPIPKDSRWSSIE